MKPEMIREAALPTSRKLLIGLAPLLGVAALLGAGLLGACNTNTVELLASNGGVIKTRVTPIDGQVPMDILWVIDNSFSMCQEQKVLRDNFDEFVGVVARTNLDFHIAVTTTHAPESGITIEPVAREAHIQSTPQPVPGNSQECLRGMGTVNGMPTAYAPLRDALQIARDCLADSNRSSEFNWTDAQIECALRSGPQQTQTGCVASSSLPDRNMDGSFDVFDIFPSSTDYRAIPRVLRAGDYRDASGNFDAARLQRDFACMSTVGTRGDGYEKGLRAAVKAVAPALTGLSTEVPGANATAPNHGFIRKGAGFALIFVTDENDCSHDGNMQELGNACGADVCEYYNSSAVADSPLVPVEQLAQELRENLAATKGVAANALPESSVLVASINGTSRRLADPFPTCGADNPTVTPVCASSLGQAYSGDRYERFIRQFVNHYPSTIVQTFGPESRLDFSKYEPIGWMCEPTFAPALNAIAEFISGEGGSCITDNIFNCETDADCPQQLFAGRQGECREFPVGGSVAPRNFCTSGVVLKLERDPAVEAFTPDINKLEYCIPGSINQLDSETDSCIISPNFYAFSPCESGTGIQYNWAESADLVNNKLSGYTLKTIFSVTPE